MSLLIGCPAETAERENRVALTPDAVARLRRTGLDVIVETGAGRAAWFPDEAYLAAGARVAARKRSMHRRTSVVVIHAPLPSNRKLLRPGQVLIGLLQPVLAPDLVVELADAKVHGAEFRPPAADAQPGSVDGRADLAGQRRRLQGRIAGR